MTEESIEKGRQVIGNVKWPFEDDLPYLYANHFAVFETPNDVVFVFGNFMPTGLVDRSDDEVKNYLSKAEIQPLAKIVVSREGLKAFLGLLKPKLDELFAQEKEGEKPND
jgi:hypothetical protein